MNTIEVYHLRHTTGRKYVAVFQDRFDTPVMKEYMEEYHAGLRKPHYKLPVPYQYNLDPEAIGDDGVFANVVLRGKHLFDSGRRLIRWRMNYYFGSGQ